MLGIAVVIAVVVGAFLLRARPATIGTIALVTWVLIPNVVATQTALSFGWHPATLIALIGLVISFIDKPSRWTGYASASVTVTLAAALTLMLLSFSQNATGYRVEFFAEQIIGTVAVFLLLIAGFRQDPSARDSFRFAFIALAGFEALLSFFQAATQSMLPYEGYYSALTWYQLEAGTRYSGTLDHPLVLGMLLACAAWMAGGLKSTVWRLVFSVTFTVATLTTLSRTASLVAIAAVLAIVLLARMHVAIRTAIIIVIAASATAVWAVFQDTTLYAKFLNDGGSSAARDSAWAVFSERVGDYILFGGGVGASGDLSTSSGSRTSLESAFAMYSVDFGVVATILFFAAMVFTVLGGLIDRRGGIFYAAPAVAALVLVQSFSSIATASATATILWSTVAYSARARSRRSPVAPPSKYRPHQHADTHGPPQPETPSLKSGNVSPAVISRRR